MSDQSQESSNDEAFDQLLRESFQEVSIPEGLKQSLLSLPEKAMAKLEVQGQGPRNEQVPEHGQVEVEAKSWVASEGRGREVAPSSNPHTSSRWWAIRTTALAICGCLLISVSAMTFFWNRGPVKEVGSIVSGEGGGGNKTAKAVDVEAFERLEREAIQLENELKTILVDGQDSLQSKRRELEALKVVNRYSHVQSTSQRVSLVLALAEKTALDRGVRSETVHKNLERIIQEYPGTDGAVVASQLLGQ